MLGTRYEDYSHLDSSLPFKLLIGRRVTPLTYSPEANWHENLEIQLCTEGEGYVMLDEKNYHFEPDDIIVVNSNVIHHTNAEKMITYSCLIIDTQFCTQIGIDPLSLQFCPKIKSGYFLSLFENLCEIYSDTSDICRTAKLNEIILKMLILLREKHTLEENSNLVKSRSFEMIKNAIKFIRSNYERKITLDEISKNVLIDKFTLSREFKKITNQTVVEYINSYRCKKAADHILSGALISDAARMCGFTNMSFFTKTFKLYMGCLPSKYSKINF